MERSSSGSRKMERDRDVGELLLKSIKCQKKKKKKKLLITVYIYNM